VCHSAALLGQGDLAHAFRGLEHAAADRLDVVLAAIILDHVGDGLGHRLSGHDVAGENLGELCLVFRLQQRVDGTCGAANAFLGAKTVNGLPFAFKRRNQPRSLDRSDERSVILGVDRVLNYVLFSYIAAPPTFGLAP
jgi:hypothetical protein